jgi:hypothetical protein
MKRILVVFGLWCTLFGGTAFADDPVVDPAVPSSEPAVVNHPRTAWDLTKATVDYLQPGYDWVIVFQEDREPYNGVSAALYTVTSKDIPLGSVRVGYSTDGEKTAYLSTTVDLPGIASRYLPASVKGLSPAVLTGAMSAATKYVRIGPVISYSFDLEEVDWGMAVGAAITLNF